MSRAEIIERAPGQLVLSGVIDHLSGPALREQGGRLILASAIARVQLDCGAVSKSNSVGLALLLAFMRDARHAGRELVISGLPEDMREIAEVSGLLELLPLQA